MPTDRRHWSRIEVEAIVADYLVMLESGTARSPVQQDGASPRPPEAPRPAHRRIEYKHQNISAVLTELGLPAIVGYKPAWNYQDLVLEVVRDRIESADSWPTSRRAPLTISVRRARASPGLLQDAGVRCLGRKLGHSSARCSGHTRRDPGARKLHNTRYQEQQMSLRRHHQAILLGWRVCHPCRAHSTLRRSKLPPPVSSSGLL